jgi:hypothetical protein
MTEKRILPGHYIEDFPVHAKLEDGEIILNHEDREVASYRPPTTLVYVDKGRTDTYTENGSEERPFKTINAAITYVEAEQMYATIVLLVGNYNENIILNGNYNILGNNAVGTVINGNVTLTSNSLGTMDNITIIGNIENFGDYIISDCGIISRITNNGRLLFINCSLSLHQNIMNFNTLELRSCYVDCDQGYSAIVSTASAIISNSQIFSVSTEPTIANQGSGTLDIHDSTVSNHSSGYSIEISSDGGTVILDVHTLGSIQCNNRSQIKIGGLPGSTEVLNDTNVTYIYDYRYYNKTQIDNILGSYYTSVDSQMIHVSKVGNDATGNGSYARPYLTVKHAINSITDASENNYYTINVMSGEFIEDNDFVLKDFISIKGVSSKSTIIKKQDGSAIQYNPVASSLTYKDVGFSGAGITITKTSNSLVDIKFESCDLDDGAELRFIGNFAFASRANNKLRIDQACYISNIYTENVSVYCLQLFSNNNLTLKGYQRSFIVGSHIDNFVTIDCMGIVNPFESAVYIDCQSMPDLSSKFILSGAAVLHHQVMLLDNAFGIGYNISTAKNITKKDVQGAINELDQLSHVENSDAYLASPLTGIIYVDSSRTDNYIQNGTITKPFKTIQAALNISTDNTIIDIAPGIYNETLVCDKIVNLRGNGIKKSNIVGNLTINVGHSYLQNLKIDGILYIKAIARLYDCDIHGSLQIVTTDTASYCNAYRCTMISQQPTYMCVKVQTFGEFRAIGCRIIGQVNLTPSIDHSYGYVRLEGCYVEGNDPSSPVIDSHLESVSAVLNLYNTEIMHTSNNPGVEAIKAFNSALEHLPNKFVNVICSGDLKTELTFSMIDGLVFNKGGLSGERNFFRSTNLITNNSNIPGLTLTAALNKINYKSGPVGSRPAAPQPGECFFDETLGRPIWWTTVGNQWVNSNGTPV